MKTKYFNIRQLALFYGLLMLLAACQEEDAISQRGGYPIGFLGIIHNEALLDTRAMMFNNITYKDYPTPLYMRMDVGNTTQTGVYTVKPGYDGRLTSLEDNHDLNWSDLTSGHTFWSWTMPWKEDDNIESEEAEIVNFDPQYYLQNSNHISQDEAINCNFMEKFIGTKKGPVEYELNGEYVELEYYHLVSKINIAGMTLVTNDGTTYQDVEGEMTIFNMPSVGYFYRHGYGGREMPYISEPSEKDLKDLTYAIGKGKTFYIHPEVTINALKFKIKLYYPQLHGETGEYYGDFSTIRLRRGDTGDDWDKDKWNSRIYANEMINLSLTLSQGNITGVTAYIQKWDDKNSGTSTNYPHPGIYTDDHANQLFNSSIPIDELEELFGEEGTLFNIYEDVAVNGANLEVPAPYTVNGMGHTITVTPDRNGNIYLQNVKDIYITDGTNTIYIDPEGKIFTVSIDGTLSDTGKQLNPGDIISYPIT